MVQEKISEESKLNYDDRRKILVQKKSQVTANKTEEVKEGDVVKEESKLVSTVNQSMEVEYTEEGIKLAYKNLVDEKEFQEKRIVKLEEQSKDAGEMTEELTKLKENLKLIGKIDAAEKQKAELDSTKERLKEVNKEINEIKETIGSRLKL